MEHGSGAESVVRALIERQLDLASSTDVLRRFRTLWVAAMLDKRLTHCTDCQIAELLSLASYLSVCARVWERLYLGSLKDGATACSREPVRHQRRRLSLAIPANESDEPEELKPESALSRVGQEGVSPSSRKWMNLLPRHFDVGLVSRVYVSGQAGAGATCKSERRRADQLASNYGTDNRSTCEPCGSFPVQFRFRNRTHSECLFSNSGVYTRTEFLGREPTNGCARQE